METFEASKHLLAEYRKARLSAQFSAVVVVALGVVLLYFSWWNPPYPTEALTAGYWIAVAGRGLGIIAIVIGLVISARLKSNSYEKVQW